MNDCDGDGGDREFRSHLSSSSSSLLLLPLLLLVAVNLAQTKSEEKFSQVCWPPVASGSFKAILRPSLVSIEKSLTVKIDRSYLSVCTDECCNYCNFCHLQSIDPSSLWPVCFSFTLSLSFNLSSSSDCFLSKSLTVSSSNLDQKLIKLGVYSSQGERERERVTKSWQKWAKDERHNNLLWYKI